MNNIDKILESINKDLKLIHQIEEISKMDLEELVKKLKSGELKITNNGGNENG